MSRVSDSVEWPNLFFGSFDENFFDLPDFLLQQYYQKKHNFLRETNGKTK